MVLAGKVLYTLVNVRDLCRPLVQSVLGLQRSQPWLLSRWQPSFPDIGLSRVPELGVATRVHAH